DNLVGAHCSRSIANSAHPQAAVMQAEEADHIVLIDAVPRHTEATDKLIAAVDRHRSGEDLQSVRQPLLPRACIRQVRAALRGVGGRSTRHETQMLREIAQNQRRLEASGERVELIYRA